MMNTRFLAQQRDELLCPTTPLGFLNMHLQDRRARLRASEDHGVSAVEWVVITVLVMGMVAVVAGILRTKINDKANSL
ncbi:MAG: hypothetical protein ACRC0L_04500, partial [Angustibacter sp.]